MGEPITVTVVGHPDPELQALDLCMSALKELSPDARLRLIAYLEGWAQERDAADRQEPPQ